MNLIYYIMFTLLALTVLGISLLVSYAWLDTRRKKKKAHFVKQTLTPTNQAA